jgi:hypothetical protein
VTQPGEGSLPVRHSPVFTALFSQVAATSDPRDPSFPKPGVLVNRATKIHLGLGNVFTAREDARPPGYARDLVGSFMLSVCGTRLANPLMGSIAP